jgi:hypothetical protein
MIDLCRNHANRIVAIGEFGLDYERTQFCDIEQQKRSVFLFIVNNTHASCERIENNVSYCDQHCSCFLLDISNFN